MTNISPRCNGCSKCPDELEEYRWAVEDTEMSPDEFVRLEEGTYNTENGHFLCTDCYISAGQPSGPRGWTAP